MSDSPLLTLRLCPQETHSNSKCRLLENASTTPYLPTSQHSAVGLSSVACMCFPMASKLTGSIYNQEQTKSQTLKYSSYQAHNGLNSPKWNIPSQTILSQGWTVYFFFHFALIGTTSHQALKTDTKVRVFTRLPGSTG